MPRYRYQATDAQGRRRSGEIEADGPDRLAQLVAAEGLSLEAFATDEPGLGPPPAALDVIPSGDADGGGPRLSEGDVADLARHLAGLTGSGLALPPGLRALAEELPRGPLRRVLVEVAARLEEGHSLEEAVARQGGRVPPHLRGVILAGLRSGRMAEVLGDFVRYEQIGWDLRRRLWLYLAYPIVLLTAMAALLVFLALVVVKPYGMIYQDFGVNLPVSTRVLLGLARGIERIGWGLVVVPLAALGLMWLAGESRLSTAVGRRFVRWIPLFGPLWRWTSLTKFSHLLALLLESRMPLTVALPLAGEGVRDAELAATGRAIARDLEAGGALIPAVIRRRLLPRGFSRILAWAEGHQALPEALHMAGEMFEARARAQAAFVGIFCLVVAVVSLIVGVGFLVVALYLPLF
ncbi:MAG TPA: type II secretion system F family protein, partial [Isosphaeraceae bacterium]